MNSEKLTLDEAKARFAASLEAVDPVKVIQEKPFKSIGIALSTGIMLGLSGRKISMLLFPGARTIAKIFKKLTA